ncbi:MAG: hypothetical protein ACFBZ8_01295 [Opitutales bacterium]
MPGRFQSLALATCLAALTVTTLAAREFSAYAIGNSLTVDTLNGGRGLETYLAAGGIQARLGYHIRCNEGLAHILEHPEESCGEDRLFKPANWEVALSTHFEVITLQPFSRSTIAAEANAMVQLIEHATKQNPRNAESIYMYLAAWPRFESGAPKETQDYAALWLTPAPDSDEAPITVLSREVHQRIFAKVQQAVSPEVTLRMAPVGEAFYAVHLAIESGRAKPLHHTSQLYRDHIHANVGFGRWLAGNVFIASALDGDPAPLGNNAATLRAYGVADFPEVLPVLKFLREIAWETVQELNVSADRDAATTVD